jgi:toxin ParE1/3/4
MTSNQGFKLHPEAARDITDIWEYIAEENPLAAGRVREDILDAIRKLVPFPDQGHRRPDLSSLPLRYQTVRNYIIAYGLKKSLSL